MVSLPLDVVYFPGCLQERIAELLGLPVAGNLRGFPVVLYGLDIAVGL